VQPGFVEKDPSNVPVLAETLSSPFDSSSIRFAVPVRHGHEAVGAVGWDEDEASRVDPSVVIIRSIHPKAGEGRVPVERDGPDTRSIDTHRDGGLSRSRIRAYQTEDEGSDQRFPQPDST